VVPSHQLTPFFTIAAVAALVVFRRVTPRGLPVLMAVLTMAWIIFMTIAFLSGHMDMVVGNLGQIGENLNANVTDRLQGSPEHIFVLHVRIVMTLAIWGLALLGALRRLHVGWWDLTIVLLAIAPFPLLVLQPYGGEMLLRVYFFALPPMVFLAAALIYPTPEAGRSRWSALASALVSLGLVAGFLFARYGNERIDYFTRDEVAAVQRLYEIAKPGDLLVTGAWNLPWQYKDFEQYGYATVRLRDIANDDTDAVAGLLAGAGGHGAYLIITRSQEAQVDLFSGLPAGALERFEEVLNASGRFRLVYRNQDASIYALADTAH